MSQAILFDRESDGRQVLIREGDLTTEVSRYLLEQGLQQVYSQARSLEREEGETDSALAARKDRNAARRLEEIRAGKLPQRGGGGRRITTTEEATRNVVEAVCKAKGTPAQEARQASQGTLRKGWPRMEQAAAVIIKSQDGKSALDQVPEDRRKTGAAKLEQALAERIETERQRLEEQANEADTLEL